DRARPRPPRHRAVARPVLRRRFDGAGDPACDPRPGGAGLARQAGGVMDTAPFAASPRIHRYPSALIDRLLLADGRSVVMRPVLPQDAQAEQLFVRGLSATSRVLRFHIGIRELAPDMLRALTDIDQRRHVAIVAQRDDEDDEDDEPAI